jgi:hypothetical protein
MEAKPTVHVPDDVHLTYDGMHEFIKHEHHIITPPPSQLTPIPEETCECNYLNPNCTVCQKHAISYAHHLEHLNVNSSKKLKEITEAYNDLRAALPDKLMEYYNDGFTAGYYTATTVVAVFSTATYFILKYFGR